MLLCVTGTCEIILNTKILCTILFVKDKGNKLIACTNRSDENIYEELDKQTNMYGRSETDTRI